MTPPPAVRVAISGCGAVTELYYAPTLRRLASEGRVRVVALHDPDPERLGLLGAGLPGAGRHTELTGALAAAPELLIVASPPSAHAAQAVAALQHGIAVLCEKPLTVTGAEAERMAQAAVAAERLLAVGMVRRHLPAARTIKLLLAERTLGRPTGFDVFEGGPFTWPVSSPAYFDRRASGGGVLVDLGAHLLDLLIWWLGAPSEVAASDDAMGGVEANALLTLGCGGVPGRIRLSRDWPRPNHVTIRGTRASLRWNLEETDLVTLTIAGADPLEIRSAAAPGPSFVDCFTAQLRAVLDALRGKPAPVVTAAELLPSIAALETAYRERTWLALPWLSDSERVAARARRAS